LKGEHIKLKPVIGASLMKAPSVVSPKEEAGRYVPPSKREVVIEVPTLSAEDIQSRTLFPTLATAKKVVAPPISWGQLRNKLAAPPPVSEPVVAPEPVAVSPHAMNFKATMEKRIEKDKKEQEEGYLQEQITNPLEMNAILLEKNGWVGLPLHSGFPEERFTLEEEDYWNAGTEWATMGFPNGGDLSKILQHGECVWLGGEPIERTTSKEPDWFTHVSYDSPMMSAYSPVKEQDARGRLLAFVGVK
jgi:hypothetical protein